MDPISSMPSSSVHELALLKLDSDSKLENLSKLVHFLSGKPQLVLTRYEVYVTLVQEEETNPSNAPQYNSYIIKEGQPEPNDESLESRKTNLKTSACQTELDSLFLDNSISLNLKCTKVDPSKGENHDDKLKVLASDVTLCEFQELCEIKQIADKRNSADQNGNNHSQYLDNSHMCGIGFSHPSQDSSTSHQDMTCDSDFDLDQKPIITSDVLIPVDSAAAREISFTLVEQPGQGDPRPFKCLECGMAFLKVESLLVHEISHAARVMETLEFHCPLCVYKSKSKTAMRDHAKEKHQMVVYLCMGCKFVALSLQQLVDHKAQSDYHRKCVMVRSMELSGQYICSRCHYAAPNATALSRHMFVHEKKTFQCQQCFLRFKTAEHLSAHSAVHEIAKPHQCVHCSYTTHSKFLLASHIKKLHLEKGKLKCKDCGLEFTNRYVLKDHAQTVHNSQDRFFCSYCTFTCPDLKTYKQHIQGHTGKEWLICDKCDYTAFVQSQMYKHQMVHRKVAPYQCCQCGHLFRDRGNMLKHMVTHQEDRNYQCETCGFRTKSERYLKHHQVMHRDTKSFKCDLCDYSTRYSGNLHKHVQTHCAEKAFSCILCNYTCRSTEALKKHRKRKHKLMK